jgi:hypothetical protein
MDKFKVRFPEDFIPVPTHKGLDRPGVEQLLRWRKEWVYRYGKDFS